MDTTFALLMLMPLAFACFALWRALAQEEREKHEKNTQLQ